MPKYKPAKIHQRSLDQSAKLPNGDLVYWENKVDYYSWLYRRGVLTFSEYEAAGGNPANVPTMEQLIERAEELDGNPEGRRCTYCDKVLLPTGEAEISYCLNCGAAG